MTQSKDNQTHDQYRLARRTPKCLEGSAERMIKG